MRVKTNSALCLHCGKCIHGICDGEKMVTSKFS